MGCCISKKKSYKNIPLPNHLIINNLPYNENFTNISENISEKIIRRKKTSIKKIGYNNSIYDIYIEELFENTKEITIKNDLINDLEFCM